MPSTASLFARAALLAAGVAWAPMQPAAAQEASAEEFRSALIELDRLERKNGYLADLVADQQRAADELTARLSAHDEAKSELVPLMTRMRESLADFVELDLPFHLERRRARVQSLEAAMSDATLSAAERLRLLIDAYRIEMEYGRDLEAYTGWLDTGGTRREVDFLRVGRLVLAYQSYDRSETGFFNPVLRQWERLPDSYRSAVNGGLRIARKQAAPAFLRLPVAPPEPGP